VSDEEPNALALREEATRTNEAHGVIAFLSGVLARIEAADSLNEALTLVEMATETLREWHEGLWKPGPQDDPANW